MKSQTASQIFFILVVIVLFAGALFNIIRSNSLMAKTQKDYGIIINEMEWEYAILGEIVDFSSFRELETGKPFQLMKRSRYLVLFVFPQFNCGQCFYKFNNVLKYIEQKNIQIIVLGWNKENMEKKKKQYFLKYPIYYSNDLKWYESKGLINGPRLLLLDGNSFRVVNTFSATYFLQNIETRYSEFIAKLNN